MNDWLREFSRVLPLSNHTAGFSAGNAERRAEYGFVIFHFPSETTFETILFDEHELNVENSHAIYEIWQALNMKILPTENSVDD